MESTVTLTTSTLSGNSASSGGGIGNWHSPVTIANSIVANNPTGGDCYSTNSLNSQGYNLAGDASCHFNATGDINNTNPQLGPLQDNGGATLTHALLPGSPAIDAGSCPGATTDQRGYLRPVDFPGVANVADGCDIGAFEVQNAAPVAVGDSYTTTVGTTLTVVAPGVLANDSDVEGQPLTAVLKTSPVSGTVSLNPDGSFVYTPTTSVEGVDQFSYVANDGSKDSNEVTVEIHLVRHRIYLPILLRDAP